MALHTIGSKSLVVQDTGHFELASGGRDVDKMWTNEKAAYVVDVNR